MVDDMKRRWDGMDTPPLDRGPFPPRSRFVLTDGFRTPKTTRSHYIVALLIVATEFICAEFRPEVDGRTIKDESLLSETLYD